jgi:hypothetical protein
VDLLLQYILTITFCFALYMVITNHYVRTVTLVSAAALAYGTPLRARGLAIQLEPQKARQNGLLGEGGPLLVFPWQSGFALLVRLCSAS